MQILSTFSKNTKKEKLNWLQNQLSNVVNVWNDDMATMTSENDIAKGNQLLGLVDNVEEVDIKGIDKTDVSTHPHVFWSQIEPLVVLSKETMDFIEKL